MAQAAKITLTGDTASIASMEFAENSMVFVIPGYMHTTLAEPLFWMGLGIILPVGFFAAFPAMYWAMKRSIGNHEKIHHH